MNTLKRDTNGFLVLNGVSAISVAKEFSRLLRETLSGYEFDCLLSLNADEPSDAICHSHDFCDANVVMDEACKALGLVTIFGSENEVATKDEDLAIEEQCNLWNEAWSIAKLAQFDPSAVDGTVRAFVAMLDE